MSLSNFHSYQKWLYLTLGLIVTMSGCGVFKNEIIVTTVQRTEAEFCSSASAYPSGITVTGTAVYRKREYSATACNGTDPGLGAEGADRPIRYAEVRVIDGSGTVIQCGSTDGSGNISLVVPNSAATLTLQVNSRGNNSFVSASVLNNPTDMQFYTLSSTFTASGTPSVGTLRATATGNILGAAFNIFDVIVKANEVLRRETSGSTTCSAYSNCTPFTVAPHISAFWTKGVNPMEYLGSSEAVSFYLPGYSQLYILGGLDGEVDSEDTDHFDDSIIAHEYGHFIEDKYAASNSAGGKHDGNSIIDPRLAWSEGWANYFEMVVNGAPVYRDTFGNTSGGTFCEMYFDYNAETNISSTDGLSKDNPISAGEGNFREFAIARTLWDAVDSNGSATLPNSDGDGVVANFYEIWTVFRTSFANTSIKFRNFGKFMELYNAHTAPTSTSLSSLLTTEKQRADEKDFPSPYSTNAVACNILITPSGGTGNAFHRKDYYRINHAGGTLNLQLHRVTGASTTNLDLYLFQESFKFNTISDISGVLASSLSTTTANDESISTSLSAGTYMVVVYAANNGTFINYNLRVNGVYVCPTL